MLKLKYASGKVLVTCYQGISRSVTLVMAYLMIKKKMNVLEAAKQVAYHQLSAPNRGFVAQLIELNQQLEKTLNG